MPFYERRFFMYKREDVDKIFNKERILIGFNDVMPLYVAEKIFGKPAAIFARQLEPGITSNTYGIGDYNFNYLTLKGVQAAATYVNICESKEISPYEKGGVLYNE